MVLTVNVYFLFWNFRNSKVLTEKGKFAEKGGNFAWDLGGFPAWVVPEVTSRKRLRSHMPVNMRGNNFISDFLELTKMSVTT